MNIDECASFCDGHFKGQANQLEKLVFGQSDLPTQKEVRRPTENGIDV